MKRKGLLAAVTAFAASPRGRRLIQQAKSYATSPEGKRKLREMRSRTSRKRRSP
jgi:hypothetical protein